MLVSDVSVIGLGKLGSPLAACLAARGFQTIGVDLDSQIVNAVNEGRAPVYEPRLDEMIQIGRSRLQATLDIEEAVLNTEATFVIVPTPSQSDGLFSLKYVIPAFEDIGRALAKKDDFHLVVLTSTVVPGMTGGQVQPAIERASGKRAGVDFGLCYNPEFIALGNVVYNLLNPDFVLIGESDPGSGEMLEQIHRKLCENDPQIARMNFVNAELTKLSVNTFVTTKISFANMLAHICENLPEADVDVVTGALGLDTRIGGKYLQGAISYGGPCFPRDNKALSALSQSIGVKATIAEATDNVNQGGITYLRDLVRKHASAGDTIGLLGLSYKPDTDVIEESVAVLLAQALLEDGYDLVVYDPAAMENTRDVLGDKVSYAESMGTCSRIADVLLITTPWTAFKAITPADLKTASRPVLVDCWRILDEDVFKNAAEYVQLGLGAQPTSEMIQP